MVSYHGELAFLVLVFDDLTLLSIGEKRVKKHGVKKKPYLHFDSTRKRQGYPGKLEPFKMPCSADISLPDAYSSRHLDQ